METLLIKYGYLVLLIGIAVEGEGFLLAASYLAHNNQIFSLPFVMLTAIVANTGANQVYYILARTRGRAWLQNRFGDHPRYQKVVSLITRHGNWILFGSRYAFGFRIIIPAACGALDMPMARFTTINVLASILWAVPTSLVGFYVGDFAEKLILGFKQHELWVVAAFLVAAAVALVIRHLRHAEWVEDLNVADLHTFVPMLIGVMGVINLVAAILPRDPATMRALQAWLPLEVTQRSRALMLFAGIALLQVWRNLSRRKELAWYVAVAALGMSILLHVTRGFDLQHSLIAGLLLSYLIYNRRRFNARSDPVSLKWGVRMIPVLAATVFVYGIIGLTHIRTHFLWHPGATPFTETIRSGFLIVQPNIEPTTEGAKRYLGSLQIAGWAARFYLLALLLRPVILRKRMEAPQDKINGIFRLHGTHSLSAFAVQSDKHHLLVGSGRGLIAYDKRGTVALSCGDPIAPDDLFEMCISGFISFCRRRGWTPCFYEAAENRLPIYEALGMRALKIADEAIVDLKEFSLSGGKRANLRAMVKRAAKTGTGVRRYDRKPLHDPWIDEQLEEISEEWLAEKHLGEMGFSIGRFSLEALAEVPLYIACVGDRVEAFCSWLPYRNGQAAVLDLFRKRKDAPIGTMDSLLAHALMHLQDSGLTEASLGNAPLANVSNPRGPLERGVALLFENMNAFYGYKNLYRFKKKFAPRWEGKYLIYPKGTELPKVAYAMAGVHLGGGLFRLLWKR